MHSNEPVTQGTAQDTTSGARFHPVILQVPAFLGNPVELNFRFTNTPPADFIRVLATAQDRLLTSYSLETEYWATGAVPGSFAGPMSMSFIYGMFTNAEAQAFLDGFTVAFSVGQQSSATAWISNAATPYTPPSGATAYLYSAPDPDNRANSIGLALVLDVRNRLVGINWYKMSDPVGGWVWQPDNSPVSGLAWTYVDSFSGTAIDPNRIATSSTWYYIPQS